MAAHGRIGADTLLCNLERQLEVVDSSLLSFEPDALTAACGELCHAAVDYARVLESLLSTRTLDRALGRRIEAISRRLKLQRASLARRSIVVDRALASIMRTPPDATYSMPGERMAFGINGPH
ncbi:MAG: hypothetical protein ABI589_04650 [Burkholderiales bacterium]